MTSSGSAVSANGVKPRRSQNTTVISRRWLSRNDSSPDVTMSSASCGDRNRRSRPTRSSSSTWACTRCLELAVPRRELGGLPLDRVVVLLDPHQGRTRASSSAWSNGLVTKSSAPASMARSFSWSPLAVIMTTGRNAVRVVADAAAHLVAVHPRHQDVEQDEVGRARQARRRLLAGRRGEDLVAAWDSTASSRRRFWGRSSTTRTRRGPVVHPSTSRGRRNAAPGRGAPDADRLLEVAVESGAQRPLAVRLIAEAVTATTGTDRVAGRPEAAQRLDAVASRAAGGP